MQDNILVVEDEAAIQNVISTYLEAAGFAVQCVSNGADALEVARATAPDLVVMDLMLPGMDGMEVTARLREESDVYILMLTARSEEADRVAGLRIGADDYLTKPFSPRELVARVEAILRRSRGNGGSINNEHRRGFRCASCRIAWRRSSGDNQLELTTTEFTLLMELGRHAGRVLTRDQIIDRVWGNDFYGTDRIVDVYIGQVRRKIEQAGGANLIQTVRGIGYKLIDEKI